MLKQCIEKLADILNNFRDLNETKTEHEGKKSIKNQKFNFLSFSYFAFEFTWGICS